MPRQIRREFSGAIYHVSNRGERREKIFRNDQDRELFLEALVEACEKTGWQIHAYCLAPDQFHLVVETPHPNLSFGMKWLAGVYTLRFNLRHKKRGRLFAGRYKVLHVEGGGKGYLRTVCDYVHFKPARAGLLRARQPLESFRWSSYGCYLESPRLRPVWLRVDRLMAEMEIPRDSEAGRRKFASSSESRRSEDLPREYRRVERGWCLGGEDFRRELLAKALRPGANRRDAQETKALRLLREEMARLGWDRAALRAASKGDKRKVAIAARLRRETTASLEWIAQHVAMGTWTYVSNLLGAKRKKEGSKK
jgi:REP element-mobilizing transposase RayT